VDTLKRFRLLSVRLALLVTAIGAGIVFPISRPAAQGLLMGGIGGVLTFWIMAVRIEKLAQLPPNKLKSKSFVWTLVRCAVYGVILWQAYLLDTETMRGFIAAAAGIFIIRLVVVFIGITGLDMRKEP